MLTPVLVSGYGRSGTTALMALLATDPRVAFDRRYPFENRYLTYLVKFCLLTGRPPSVHLDSVQLAIIAMTASAPRPGVHKNPPHGR